MSDLELAPDKVAGYLRRHPGFLNEYPDLALSLTMPRQSGAATSLTSYQLDVLRDKNRDLSQRLAELVGVAQENLALVGRVHQLALRLLRARGFRDAVLAIAASLREDFHTDLVRLCLINLPRLMLDEDWLIEIGDEEQGLNAFGEFLHKQQPLCGRLRQEKLEFLYAGRADDVASAVLLPLGRYGFLGIGSGDPNRFHPGMGTVFLEQIARLCETAIGVHAEREA